MKRALLECIVIAVAIAWPMSARGQSVFLGSVVADGDVAPPLPDAEVTLPELNLGARTDSLGRFLFKDIPKGRFRVIIRRVGYNAISVYARFSGADTLAADFALISNAVALDTVNVTGARSTHGKLLDFEDRRTHGVGSFLTRSDMDRQRDHSLGEIVAKLPGVRLNRYGSESAVASARFIGGPGRGGDAMDRRKGAPRGCYAQVYVDNVRVFSSAVGEALFNINSIAPATVQGIEFYSSREETPIQYATSQADCGTMLIWTRIE